MRKQKTRLLAALTVLLGSVPALQAAPRSLENGLSLVPESAAAVAVIRFTDLRSNPLGNQLFRDFDSITVDGDAARFLEETHLKPSQDIDTLVIAGMPSTPGASDGQIVMFFEGRFEPEKLTAAVVERGAIRRGSPQGEFFLMPGKKQQPSQKNMAVAFVSRQLMIAGTETAVEQAVQSRSNGGTKFLMSQGLGRYMNLIETGASAFALVDMTRFPKFQKGRVEVNSGSGSDAGRVLVGAMSSVTLLAVQATAKGDSLSLSALGLSNDEETRELLEDALRGILAAWRLAAQEKSPQTVSVLRRFKVSRNDEGVQISGTLPGEAVRYLAQQREKKQGERGKE